MIVPLYHIKRLAAGIFLMLAASLSVFATDIVSSGQLYYHLDEQSHSAQLTYMAYDSTNVQAYTGQVIVPATIDVGGQQHAVVGVSPLACVYCSGLSSITLPEGLTQVGFGAFSDCSQLHTVSLPSSLTTLGDWAFYHDGALTSLQLPTLLGRVSACAFGFCTALADVSLPAQLQAIAPQAFYFCSSLQQLSLPASVDQIGEYAFAYCSSLQQFSLYDAPIAITPDVFEGVDVSQVRLVVPTDQLQAYRQAEVWNRFQIVDGGYDALPSVDVPSRILYNMYLSGSVLHLTPLADAPVFVYDLEGHRVAIAPTHSGETQVSLAPGTYLLRCGKQSQKIQNH